MAADLIADYLAHLQLRGYAPLSITAYARDLRQAERDLGAAGVAIAVATADDLDALVTGWARRGLRGTTIRRKQASLRGLYRWAVKKRRLAADPTGELEAPKTEARLPNYLRDEEVDQLLAALGDADPVARREAAAVAALYYTGMRACELLRLAVADVDLLAGTLRVFGKGRRERVIPAPAALLPYLERWLAVRPGRADGPLLVTLHRPYGKLGWDGLDRLVKGALARAGLGDRRITAHKLRHTFATRLINRRVPIDKIQKLLGHRRIDTTTIYAHTELGRDLRDQLDGAL